METDGSDPSKDKNSRRNDDASGKNGDWQIICIFKEEIKSPLYDSTWSINKAQLGLTFRRRERRRERSTRETRRKKHEGDEETEAQRRRGDRRPKEMRRKKHKGDEQIEARGR